MFDGQSPQPQGEADNIMPVVVRFQVDTCEALVQAYSRAVTPGGMFLRTLRVPPLAPGRRIMLRFLLADGREVFAARAIVAWLQVEPAGMGIHFERLSAGGAHLYRAWLAHKYGPAALPQCERELAEFFDLPTRPFARAARYGPEMACVEPTEPDGAITDEPPPLLLTRRRKRGPPPLPPRRIRREQLTPRHLGSISERAVRAAQPPPERGSSRS